MLVNEMLWALVNTLLRISALTSINKILQSPKIKNISAIVISISALYGIASVLVGTLICRPIRASWDPHVKGVCGNQITAYIYMEAIGLALDIAILVLPLPTIWSLHMLKSKKLRFSLILSAGGLYVSVRGLLNHID